MPIRKISTREHIQKLIEEGTCKTLQDFADIIGITRSRVNQVIKEHSLPWISLQGKFEWPCPSCKVEISIHRSDKPIKFWPAHCTKCRKGLLKKFYRVCLHPKTPENTIASGCKICIHAKARCIVEIRTCTVCDESLKISRGVQRQIHMGNTIGMFHRSCYLQLPKDSIMQSLR